MKSKETKGAQKFKPNDDQKRAIKIRDCDVFVSAAAGSGKTKVMTERFVEAVRDDKTPVNRILTITFTNEAAAQLQEKIAARLLEEGLVGEARSVPDAYISTIHSFCSRVLRAHAFAAGIDPNFVMLEDARAKTVVEDAVDIALMEFADRGEKQLDFISQIGKKTLAQTIVSLHEALRSAGFINPVEGFPDPLGDNWERPRYIELIERLEQMLKEALTKADRDSGPKTYVANFAVAEDLLTHLGIYGRDTLPGLSARFKLNTVANASKAVFGEAKELLKGVDESIAASMAQAYHGFYAELLQIYSRVYQEQKALVSGLDFEDLQLLTKKLLKEHPGIRKGYRVKFQQIMVDEFQDTNRLQCDLINLLANNNAFTVGDENQSIYRFRHADVSVFRSLRDSVEEKSADFSIKLPQNYRSRKELISFVNRVGTGFKLFDEKNLPLVPGRTHGFICLDGPAVELSIVDEKRGAADPAYAEASYIAKKIAELLAEKKYRPGEIAILIPKRTKLKVLEAALRDGGVDYYTISGSGYYSIDEVAELKDLLSVMVNPYDDLALIGVLRGPCVRLSDDALFLVRMAASKIASSAPLWSALVSSRLELAESDREKLTKFLATLAKLRHFTTHANLSAIIERAVSATGYDLTCLMRDQKGALRYANIRKLMELADAYEAIHGPKLAGFVEHLAKQKELSSQEGEAALADGEAGAVRIMTVHAAKGLQFPVVFLALSKGKPIYGAPGSSEMLVLNGNRVAFRVAGLTKTYEAPGFGELKEGLKQQSDSEDRRLLHVALTRAEERLFITGICNIEKDLTKADTNTYIEWLMAALKIKHGEICRIRDEGIDFWQDEGIDFKIIKPELIMLDGAAKRAKTRAALPAIDLGSLLPVNLKRSLHLRELSYSALEDFRACPRRFLLRHVEAIAVKPHALGTGTKTGLDAASFGTLIHELMQSLDVFAGAEAALDIAYESYPGLSPAEQRRIEQIMQGFFGSEVAKRLAEAQSVQKEVPFIYSVAGMTLSGRLDVLAYEPTQPFIVDYKTGKIGEDLRALTQKYELQMAIYALALLKGGASRVEVLIVALENGSKAVSRLYTQSDKAGLENKVSEIINDMKRPDQSWPATAEHNFCRFCEFALFCGRRY